MYNFFLPDEEELKKVIQGTLNGKDALVSAKIILPSWTNITMDVHGEVGDYIFRFPRNSFFARMMVKDCSFCRFLQGKVTLPISDMHLKIDKNRPFSVHKKLKGLALDSQLEKLTPSEKAGIIDDLSRFLMELHALPVNSMPIDIRESLGDFLTGLASVHQGNYDLSRHCRLYEMETETPTPVIVHGDFHPGNVLVDNGCLSGIIDFSMASVSDRHADLGRFLGRSNPAWGGALIESYQAKNRTPCDPKKVQDVVDVFAYAESKYIAYVKANCAQIRTYNSVLTSFPGPIKGIPTR